MSMRSLALLMALLSGLAATGMASSARAAEEGFVLPGTGSVQGYLPGVTPQAPLVAEPRVTCEQAYIDRARDGLMPQRGPRYRAVNVCRRDGGPEFVSPMLPPSNLRQLRGLPY
ncbi:hypothetical protein ACLE20_09830 [Rhizobium sp. YIM 134829]|uniref:hypothetical protein n=1 Tax=Rhizobium sp. YIM 134829 TaxID=3390453 RepID=UPI003979449B